MRKILIAGIFSALVLAMTSTSLPMAAYASHDRITLIVRVDDRDELTDILENDDKREQFVDHIADRAQHIDDDVDSVNLVIVYEDKDKIAGEHITEQVEDLVNDELESRNYRDGHDKYRLKDIYDFDMDFDHFFYYWR